jgi:RluA family pseudouridine synthase
MLNYTLTVADHGRRTDSFLRNLLPAASSAYLHQLIKSGAVTVNGDPASQEAMLRLSDTVSIKETSRIRSLLSGAKTAADILYEDDRIVVFNKPAGLPVHSSVEHGAHNMAELGAATLAIRGIQVKLYPVNRLDKNTSGVVIMAKSSSNAGLFGKLFQEGLVRKSYLAVVRGRVEKTGVIDIPLDGKESRSEFRTLYSGKGVTVLAVTPVTGRQHQIRRHLAECGHPVMGDRRYGGKPAHGITGHALHSCRTSFLHPIDNSEVRLFAPLQEPFALYLSRVVGDGFQVFLHELVSECSNGTPLGLTL